MLSMGAKIRDQFRGWEASHEEPMSVMEAAMLQTST